MARDVPADRRTQVWLVAIRTPVSGDGRSRKALVEARLNGPTIGSAVSAIGEGMVLASLAVAA